MIREDVRLGHGVVIQHPDQVNLYGCEIGDNTKIGAFVEIRSQVKVGKNCTIQAFVFIPEGVTIEDQVFIGPHVCFTNNRYPKIGRGRQIQTTLVRHGVSIGASSVILPGIIIGEGALIAAGSVVTRDVESHMLAMGNPARPIRRIITGDE